ncbi:MAG: hypothetical protein CVV52_00455 [Spirochaetae bacterium HGW-Spirochaetae-8]|jgi:hypothetical protein|nr:MAG: hypothetical protein CVV52_00455 [Spirochaetae bacterium HGW-Spirochaetae-8]
MSGKSKTWFGFSYFLLPAVLKVLYVIGTIVMLAGGVYVIVDLWSSTNLETRILYIVMAALSPFFVRFVFELLLLPFRIAEDLRAIRLRYEQPPKAMEFEQRRSRAPEPIPTPRPTPAPTPAPAPVSASPVPQQPLRPVQAVPTPRIQPMPTPKPVEVQPASLEGDRVAQALRTNDPFSAPPVQRTDREQ